MEGFCDRSRPIASDTTPATTPTTNGVSQLLLLLLLRGGGGGGGGVRGMEFAQRDMRAHSRAQGVIAPAAAPEATTKDATTERVAPEGVIASAGMAAAAGACVRASRGGACPSARPLAQNASSGRSGEHMHTPLDRLPTHPHTRAVLPSSNACVVRSIPRGGGGSGGRRSGGARCDHERCGQGGARHDDARGEAWCLRHERRRGRGGGGHGGDRDAGPCEARAARRRGSSRGAHGGGGGRRVIAHSGNPAAVHNVPGRRRAREGGPGGRRDGASGRPCAVRCRAHTARK